MRPLLILDVDETLIHSTEFSKFEYDFKTLKFYTKKRPFLDEFISYAFENFDVAIWSFGEDTYVNEILNSIGIDKEKLKFIYTKNNCVVRQSDFFSEYGVKNLNKIKNKYGIPDNLDRVLIVDNDARTAVNNISNLIQIRSFTKDNNDVELLKLISYLEKIKGEPNYRRVEKRGWSK